MPLDLEVDNCCPTNLDKGVSITKERENENEMNVKVGLGTAHVTKVTRDLPTNSLSVCGKVNGDVNVSVGLGTARLPRVARGLPTSSVSMCELAWAMKVGDISL